MYLSIIFITESFFIANVNFVKVAAAFPHQPPSSLRRFIQHFPYQQGYFFVAVVFEIFSRYAASHITGPV